MAKRSDAVLRSVRGGRRGTSSLRSWLGLRTLGFEPLENRRLLSVAATLPASGQAQPAYESPGIPDPTESFDYIVHHPIQTSGSGVTPAASSVGSTWFTPTEIQSAYGISAISGMTNLGKGQTIAIIDAYNDSDIISDAKQFCTTFNYLPQFNTGGPTFTVLNENGGTSLSGVPASGTSGTSDWSLEESLDVEWAHSIAPHANIILYEANSDSFSDLLTAVDYAATHGASVVSMSWGGDEFSGENTYDSNFQTAGVTFVASTGDNGSPGGYPAYSPWVVAVGGTDLAYPLGSGNAWNGETAWSDSGGGVSTQEPKQSWETSYGNLNPTNPLATATNRAIPDVSFQADVTASAGVAVYDSYDSSDWVNVGGTSVGAPCWSGLIAIADQLRVNNGFTTLSSVQAQTILYAANAADFHDITSGSNGGYSAGPGYDMVTGLGTPIANLLVPQLGGPSITLTPSASSLPTAAQQQFTATALDQFGNPISPLPPLTWTATGGSVSSSGLFNAAATVGTATVTAAASGLVNATVTDTLVAPSTWWTFDNTANDSSGNGHTGTISNATWTTGIYGDALQFNGTNSSVTSAGASLNGTGNFTVGAWIKTTASAAGVIIQQRGSSNGQYQLSMTATGRINFWLRSSANSYQFNLTSPQAQAINNGQWHYIAAVRNGTTGYLYIDAVLAASGSSSGTLRSLSSANGVSVGGDTVAKSTYFNGTIDNVQIYAYAIGASGIASMATSTPTITAAAAPTSSPVTGTTMGLTVGAAGDAGPSSLTYTWTTTGTPPAAVVFSPNGTNAAQATTATFAAAGVYNFLVTVVDPFGLEATSSVSVTVIQTLTSIAVAPATPTLASDGMQQFTAAGSDQFDAAMALGSTTWSATGGSISSSGLFKAPYASASVTVTATSGPVSAPVTGTTVVTVNNTAPTVTTAAAPTSNPVAGTSVGLTVGAEDDAGPSNLTYTWTTTGTPPAAVNFSVNGDSTANGTNAAQDITATFTQAGTYNFLVTITDMGGLSTTSPTSVTVNQTFTSFGVNSLPFGATALDQFGNPLPPANQPPSPWSLDGNGGIAFGSGPGVAVNLDGASPSFADVTFNGTGYTIGQQGAGGTLQLANGASPATVTVAAGSDAISAPLELASNVTFLPAAGSQLTISGGISGAGQSLSVDGVGGEVVLMGTNTFSGATDFAGELVLASPSAIAAGTSLMIGGGTFDFPSSVAAPDGTSAATSAVASTPSAAASAPSAAASSDASLTTAAPSTANLALSSLVSARGPIAAYGPSAGPDVVKHGPARNSQSPQSPLAALQPPPSVAAGALATPVADRLVGPSIADRVAGDLAWLRPPANSSDSSDPDQKKDVAILALDAVFAQYGQWSRIG